ncbi:MAG: AP2 domain-containing protein [Oscillospiraceae bacterium]
MPGNKRLVARICKMCGQQFEGTTQKMYCPDCVIARRNASSNKSYYRSKVGLSRPRKNDTPGVTMQHGKYIAQISVSGVQRRIGTFQTVEEAIEYQKSAQQHVDSGDFDAWFSTLKPSKRVKVGSSGVSGVTSVNGEGWRASISISGRSRYLGEFSTVEEASDRQKLAQRHLDSGDFDAWLDSVRSPHGARIGASGVPKIAKLKNGRWKAFFHTSGNRYYLGTFQTVEESAERQKLAQQHVDSGDFNAWLSALEPNKPIHVGSSGVPGVTALKGEGWKATIFASGRYRYIGKFPTVEEAVAYQKLAQQHIDVGDFDTWVDEIRSPLKGVYQEKNGKWTANIRLNGRRIRAGTFSTADEAAAAATNARATWRICPVCGGPIKDKQSTCCSSACAGVYRLGVEPPKIPPAT